jgi:hypothetical protein
MPFKDMRRFTAAEIEALTKGVIDRKVVENWHNRGLWLTPGESPPPGRPRQYSIAHLFEALTRAHLVEGGFTHAAARRAIELRLATPAFDSVRPTLRARVAQKAVEEKEPPTQICNLPELKQPVSDWYWAIYYGPHKKKSAELAETIAFKGDVVTSQVASDLVTIVPISNIVQELFAYVERDY